MHKKLLLIVLVLLTLAVMVMPVSADRPAPPLVAPPDEPQAEGTVRLTGELFTRSGSIYDLYSWGALNLELGYYCSIEGVYRKVNFGPANLYREGGHFYYWLDVVADDPTTAELEGPSALGQGANFVYNWVPRVTAPQPLLGIIRDRALKYTPDPDPQGPLPRVVVQDLTFNLVD